MDDDLEDIKRKKLEELKERFAEPAKPEIKFPERPIVVTDGSLRGAVMQYPLLIVDCWAEWCGPCRMIAPVLDELAKDYAGKVVFGKLNVDENMQTARAFEITAIPMLLIFKNGKFIDKLVGAYPKHMLEQKVQSYL